MGEQGAETRLGQVQPAAAEPRAQAVAPRARARTLSRGEWAVFAAIAAAGALLRFHALAAQSFWYDEAVSVSLARAPWVDLVTGRVRDLGNPPLYLVLLHVWGALAGWSDASVRALSALASTATLPVLFAAALRLADRRAALLATALLAAAPFHVYLGQEARAYALAGLLGAASVLLLLRAVERPGSLARWVAWGLSAAAGLWTHYSTGFLLLGEALWVLSAVRRDRRILGGAVGALGFAASLFGPWLPALFGQLGTHGNLARSAETWWLQAAATPVVFAAGTTLAWKDGVTLPRAALAVAGAAALAIPAAAAVWGGRRLPARLLSAAWVAAVILVPLSISVALFPLYHVRYVAVALPGWLLLAAIGVGRASGPARALALGAVALTAGASLARYYGQPQKHEWRSAVAAIEARTAPGDLLLFDAGFNETSFERYATARHDRLRLGAVEADRLAAARAAGAPFEDVREEVAARDRVWLVLSDEAARRDARLDSLGDRRVADTLRFRGIEALLLVRRSPGGEPPRRAARTVHP
jgi:mannosyltransferase